jgi:NTE family protein
MIEKKEIKLAISGSGTVFYLHFGGVKCLSDYFTISEVIGTSGGSIIAALIALGYSIDEIEKILREVNLKDNTDWSFNPLYRYGLMKGDKINEILKKYLNKTFKETKIPLTVTVTNIKTSKAVYYSTVNTPDKNIYEAVRASMSIPILFKYVILDNAICVDGGLIDNFPADYFKTTTKVFGLRVLAKSITDFKPIDDVPFNPISPYYWKMLFLSFFEYLFLLLNIILTNMDQKHIDDAVYCNIITLKTDYNNLSFNHSATDINSMILQGYSTTYNFLKDNNEI